MALRLQNLTTGSAGPVTDRPQAELGDPLHLGRAWRAAQPQVLGHLAHRNEAALLELLASGRALPHVGATFTLAEAAAALRQVADGKAIGKVVLVIGLGETPPSVQGNQDLRTERTRGDYRTAWLV